ncbi:uncharacterized protein LOC143458741 [Clavelina lepadiformis]|uniref:uncharacterized protein LOC143458741 n=1 Tax=Clavelina lepadiformis TaxID=159417 RepID=UPI0040420CA7
MTQIVVYSQNVSCDSTSERLQDKYGDDFSFSNRVHHVIDQLQSKEVDVVILNEIRYADNVTLVINSLESKGFIAKKFANNSSQLTLCNIMAISKKSEWIPKLWKHLWVAKDENDHPCLRDTHSLIEGDRHGRSAGVVYLHHKKSKQQVCILGSHVMPFGDVKYAQQNALLSLNKENSSVPTIIAGDMNRFWNENDTFQEQLKLYNLIEAMPTKLVIPLSANENIIKDNEDVGTFMPWPTDEKIYSMKLYEPMSTSRLDTQLYSHDTSMITCEQVVSKATMLHKPDESEPQKYVNQTRHMLNLRMASDHTAIIGRYMIY